MQESAAEQEIPADIVADGWVLHPRYPPYFISLPGQHIAVSEKTLPEAIARIRNLQAISQRLDAEEAAKATKNTRRRKKQSMSSTADQQAWIPEELAARGWKALHAKKPHWLTNHFGGTVGVTVTGSDQADVLSKVREYEAKALEVKQARETEAAKPKRSKRTPKPDPRPSELPEPLITQEAMEL